MTLYLTQSRREHRVCTALRSCCPSGWNTRGYDACFFESLRILRETIKTVFSRVIGLMLLSIDDTDDTNASRGGFFPHTKFTKKHKKHGTALADDALTEALDNYFTQHEYITVRNYAMLCRCSLSTARRHIADMLVDGRLEKSGIAKGLYKRNG